MTTAIYTLNSPLHNEAQVDASTRLFLESLNIEHEFKGKDYSDYGNHHIVLAGDHKQALDTLMSTL